MPSEVGVVCAEGTFSAFNKTFQIPSSDISGIGVVIAFSAAAYASFFLGIIFYLRGCVTPELLTDFEKKFIKQRVDAQAVADFQRGVLVVSDQQMVTALGVLGASMRHMKDYTMFDFQTIIYLAWMATNMQLSTLSILRSLFRHRPRLRAFKLFNMLALLVMMCIAIFPTTDYDWADHTVYDIGFCLTADSFWGLTETVGLHWHNALEEHRLVPQGVVAYAIIIISHAWQAAMLFPNIRFQASKSAID
ncbi:hypothetical protein BCR34DRAFT_615778 [Clohesyomyces aquaticus]|uniref:Uncharacterized protein n=1 Tax=Clohesyomyces aquaticus TaxID=1231657 RepID=A0A1Y1ZGN1_9PLEO|nr:hypothetical protein BCR34DRAFT_615778 [Clohesyomyces aquaticus]